MNKGISQINLIPHLPLSALIPLLLVAVSAGDLTAATGNKPTAQRSATSHLYPLHSQPHTRDNLV